MRTETVFVFSSMRCAIPLPLAQRSAPFRCPFLSARSRRLGSQQRSSSEGLRRRRALATRFGARSVYVAVGGVGEKGARATSALTVGSPPSAATLLPLMRPRPGCSFYASQETHSTGRERVCCLVDVSPSA